MKKLLIITIILLSGCTSQRVRPEDLSSWENKSVVTLESHPMFSTLPRDKRELTEDEYLINYTERHTVTQGTGECFGPAYGDGFHGRRNYHGAYSGATFCDQRESYEDNCVHQFLIKDQKVVSYKVLGHSCYTTCKNQPLPCP